MFASFRAKRMPDQLVSDYYGPPSINGAMPVLPLMTTHTAGTTDYINQVPTADCTTCGGEYGTFGSDNTQVQEETNEDITEEVPPAPAVTTAPEPTVYTTQKPKTKTTKRKPKPVAPKDEDEEEEEEENGWPFAQAEPRKKVPSYNVFFPMMFGYPGSFGRSGSEDAGGFGTAAIANSFSTGHGGVATSHATAFGTPSSSHRNSNWKRKSQTED